MTASEMTPSMDVTLDDVRNGTRRIFGESFEQTWAMICDRAGVQVESADIDDTGFDAFLSSLAEEGPLCRVLAMSWRIRRSAVRKLAELEG